MGRGKGHIPIRTCICCRRKGPKDKFIRLVADSSGQVLMDKRGDMKGRGAYICKNPGCLERLFKHKQLRRVFKGDQDMILSPDIKIQSGFQGDQEIKKTIFGGLDG
ncbi:MAG: YlxR family protein [Deltaproteobacteria bacterium]|nr:YlxR family protein [Deltaproteobacteria bacterium]MBW2137104.1 YlxR family protein [Deltaproteobacteria bacterium]